MNPRVQHWILVGAVGILVTTALSAIIYLVAPHFDLVPAWIGLVIGTFAVGRAFDPREPRSPKDRV